MIAFNSERWADFERPFQPAHRSAPRSRSIVFTARCYASAVLAMGLCLSVCLSVRHKSEFYRNGWTNRAGFGMWASFHPSYTELKGNSVISTNKGTSVWNFVLNSGLRKFHHGISIVENCYQLSSRKVDAQSVINWAVDKSIIPPSSDARPLLFIAQIIKRCLQHNFVARVN